MKNPITNAYWKLDSFLVDRANEAVKAWNWTTGRTRADLAFLISGIGAILETGDDIFFGMCFGVSAFKFYQGNRIQDYFESREDNIKQPITDLSNRFYKVLGPSMIGTGTLLSPIDDDPIGTTCILFGLSNYVMRADYQKPRKDCVRRGLEKLTEAIKHRELAPEMARYDSGQDMEK